MNEDRRKRLTEIAKSLNELNDLRHDIEGEINGLLDYIGEHWAGVLNTVGELKNRIRGLYIDVETIKEEEEEALENMPEGLQSSEKGEAAQASIDALDSALNSLDDVVSLDVDENVELPDIDISSLDTALAMIEEARDD
jgi:hypothetical protein